MLHHSRNAAAQLGVTWMHCWPTAWQSGLRICLYVRSTDPEYSEEVKIAALERHRNFGSSVSIPWYFTRSNYMVNKLWMWNLISDNMNLSIVARSGRVYGVRSRVWSVGKWPHRAHLHSFHPGSHVEHVTILDTWLNERGCVPYLYAGKGWRRDERKWIMRNSPISEIGLLVVENTVPFQLPVLSCLGGKHRLIGWYWIIKTESLQRNGRLCM